MVGGSQLWPIATSIAVTQYTTQSKRQLIFCKLSNWVVFWFVYFTLYAVYKVKAGFIMVLISTTQSKHFAFIKIIKPLTSVLVQIHKTFFCQILYFFFLFSAFCTKNIEKGYFNQGLECAVPKHWSKYKSHVTTHMKLLPYHRATVAWFWSNSFL